jgi:large conductance mechanosensitive channel
MQDRKSLLKEFKDFIWSGDLILIAVGLILALKVKDVIDAFMSGIVSPLIGSIIQAPNLDQKSFTIGDGRYLYGSVITAIINLILVGLVLFGIVKAYKAYQARKAAAGEAGPSEVELLTQIRDELRSRPR